MNRQLIVITIALVALALGSPTHPRERDYGQHQNNQGGSFGTGEQHSSTLLVSSETGYEHGQQANQMHSGGHGGYNQGGLHHGGLNQGGGFGQGGLNQGGFGQGGLNQGGFGQGGLNQGGSHHGGLNQGGGFGQSGLNQGGFGQGGSHHGGLNQGGGFGQGGLNQGGFGQSGLNQGGFGQSGLNQGGFGQGGLNQGGLGQGNFRMAGESEDIQTQTGIYEAGLSGGVLSQAPALTTSGWSTIPTRPNRKISSSAIILPISYNNEQESTSLSPQLTSLVH